jgi:hypothetical protein
MTLNVWSFCLSLLPRLGLQGDTDAARVGDRDCGSLLEHSWLTFQVPAPWQAAPVTPLPEHVERNVYKAPLGSRAERREGREKSLQFTGDTVPYIDVTVGEVRLPCAERQVASAYLPVDGILKTVLICSLSPERQFQNES